MWCMCVWCMCVCGVVCDVVVCMCVWCVFETDTSTSWQTFMNMTIAILKLASLYFCTSKNCRSVRVCVKGGVCVEGECKGRCEGV